MPNAVMRGRGQFTSRRHPRAQIRLFNVIIRPTVVAAGSDLANVSRARCHYVSLIVKHRRLGVIE